MKVEYDAFLSHNSNDSSVVTEIAGHLGSRGIKVWLDTRECVAGTLFLEKIEQGIRNSKAVAIMIGPGNMGPWVMTELRVSLNENISRQIPVIPVLLPDAPEAPDVPIFLKQFTWVDMRKGITEDGIDDLASGITGVPSGRSLSQTIPLVAESSSSLVAQRPLQNHKEEQRHIDALAMPIIKRKLHVSSEIIAQDAASSAAIAAKSYPNDALTLLVPLLIDMRWRRAYAIALKRILKMPETTKRIGDYLCEDINALSRETGGILSAECCSGDQVVIRVDGDSVVKVVNVSGNEAKSIVDSVNRYGRLGLRREAGLSLFERIKAIQVSTSDRAQSDQLADLLYRQRNVLIPLLARWGMPGSSWLLPQEEDYPKDKPQAYNQCPNQRRTPEESQGSRRPTIPEVSAGNVEAISSSKAWSPRIAKGSFDHELLRQLLQQLGSKNTEPTR